MKAASAALLAGIAWSSMALAQPAPVAGRDSGFAAPAVSGARLAGQRGGTAKTVVEQNGQLSDATARNVVTGANAIRDGSFANAVGLTTVIQNSGANVLIQNSMTVNVQFK